MPDFIVIREGDRRLLSLQVFRATGSVPNLSLGGGAGSAPRFIVSRNIGGSVLFSARSGAGHRVLRSTNATSGKFFVSLNAAATSGVTPGVDPAALVRHISAYGTSVTQEYRAGFLVVEGQVR